MRQPLKITANVVFSDQMNKEKKRRKQTENKKDRGESDLARKPKGEINKPPPPLPQCHREMTTQRGRENERTNGLLN